MNKISLAIAATAIMALSGATAMAQDRKPMDSHDQQVTKDWYDQNKSHPPAGLRTQDRLSADQESNFKEGETLNMGMRHRIHPAPPELTRQLAPTSKNERYVAIGGHVGVIDNKYQVKAVVHLHEN
jgi:hypothetical protein